MPCSVAALMAHCLGRAHSFTPCKANATKYRILSVNPNNRPVCRCSCHAGVTNSVYTWSLVAKFRAIAQKLDQAGVRFTEFKNGQTWASKPTNTKYKRDQNKSNTQTKYQKRGDGLTPRQLLITAATRSVIRKAFRCSQYGPRKVRCQSGEK